MTNAEHLIENAIKCLEDKSGYEGFMESPCNKAMAESININLQHIWEMAQHVYCSIKPLWEDDLMEKEAMTNGDKIRQMSNEELMENIISSGLRGCDFCIYICMSRECIDVRNGCKKGIKAYLESEIEDGKVYE